MPCSNCQDAKNAEWSRQKVQKMMKLNTAIKALEEFFPEEAASLATKLEELKASRPPAEE